MKNFFKNYFSTLLFIGIGILFYRKSEYHLENFLRGDLSFLSFQTSVESIFTMIIGLYIILLIPFYIKYPEIESKALIVIQYFGKILRGDNSYSKKEQTALLAWIVKLFFAPLMISWLANHVFNMLNNIHATTQNLSLISTDFLTFFNSNFFWMAFSVILFIDVLFFTLGYLLEGPLFKNTIKSVEPTLIGWAVAILCYPPFNSNVTNIIGWYSNDFPTFANSSTHIIMNISILILMAIYSRASFALGLKASNLTNRGIIQSGPYKYIRHPAYICKNLAWFIGAMPIVYIAITSDSLSIFAVLIGVFGWAFMYYMRAMTEENHLSADPDYIQYKKQVPYKFIPKVW